MNHIKAIKTYKIDRKTYSLINVTKGVREIA